MKFEELNELLFEDSYEREQKKNELSSDEKNDILKFFLDNKNPDDSQFHGWAESEAIDIHKAEEYAYELAHKFATFKDGGRWNQEGQPEVDQKELQMGIQVEYEHTSNEEIAKRIALDHLTELPDYYTRLAKMETEGLKAHGKEEKIERQEEYEDE